MDDAHELWQRALATVAKRGLKTGGASTPAEIAGRAQESLGEPRLSAFVWGFYYPRLFGDDTGSMSVEEARRLVLEMERGAPAFSPAPEPAPETADRCLICGRRRN